MSIWLFRAGRNGEYESRFLEDKRIYLTWDGLNVDLSGNRIEINSYKN